MTLDPAKIHEDAYLEGAIANYREYYAAYYQRCARPDNPKMRDPNPVVVLLPGIGLMTFATDKTTARLASEFYSNAINVMRGAESIGSYPAFYSSVVSDWGTSILAARELGSKANLIDLGHHAPNTNIEQIVARLHRFGKLGGFHFNDSKYGDDDSRYGVDQSSPAVPHLQ